MKETPKETADRLINKYKDHVNPYIGSGMLTNTHDDDTILWQARQCALITVREIINNFGLPSNGSNFYCAYNAIEHYQECEKLLTKD